MSKKIEVGEYLLDKEIADIYVFAPSNKIGLERVCSAIDSDGGQTCDVNGVLKALNAAGYVVSCK